jgi:hypothetical protein
MEKENKSNINVIYEEITDEKIKKNIKKITKFKLFKMVFLYLLSIIIYIYHYLSLV